MKKAIALLALSLTLGGVSSGALSQTSFFDDFNRPDSQIVGNGWIDSPFELPYGGSDHLMIKNGQLTTRANGYTGIYRPFSFSEPVSISATLAETNGFGGLLNRYNAGISILSDGNFGNGYSVDFARGDQNFNDSRIMLSDGFNLIATYSPLIQFGHQIDIQLKFGIDGSVIGSIGQNGQSESFSFGPHHVLSSGSNVSIRLDTADARVANPTWHRLDDFSIAAVPEPETYALLLAGLGLLGFAARRRKLKAAQA